MCLKSPARALDEKSKIKNLKSKMLEYVPSTVEHNQDGAWRKVVVGQTRCGAVARRAHRRGASARRGVRGRGGKTLPSRTLARIVGADSAASSHAPPMPSDITGTNVFNTSTPASLCAAAPVFTDVLLADEINRTAAQDAVGAAEAMEERQVTIDGEHAPPLSALHRLRHRETHRVRGHVPLPEAQLDRFLIKTSSTTDRGGGAAGRRSNWARASARGVLDRSTCAHSLSPTRHALPRGGARRADGAGRATLSVEAGWRRTREQPGGRPRREPARERGAAALLEGSVGDARRDFAATDDVRDVARPALRHRLACAPRPS